MKISCFASEQNLKTTLNKFPTSAEGGVAYAPHVASRSAPKDNSTSPLARWGQIYCLQGSQYVRLCMTAQKSFCLSQVHWKTWTFLFRTEQTER